MNVSRKSFLKGAAAVAIGAAIAPEPAEASNNVSRTEGQGMIHGATLLTLKRDGEYRLGVKTERGILDVVEASRILQMYAPATMDDLLQRRDGPSLRALIDKALAAPNTEIAFHKEASIVYGPVVSRPEKIVCVGLNYVKHVEEGKFTPPKQPVLFNKYNNALSGHNNKIQLPTDVAQKFDYEVELVAIIGKTAKKVAEADALSYVAGYAVGNDFSARDLQMDSGGQWMIGKTCDGFAVLGPYMVSADQVDPSNLNIELRVNGETRQTSNTNQMIFSVPKIISYISHHFPLAPGDIIYTGTPHGTIIGFPEERQVWLKAGDKIACSIDKLGEQRFDLA